MLVLFTSYLESASCGCGDTETN
ncbi:hypothetical protein NC651_025957 [Populus alba x Populus x berolinensis]|nr:hypothetical protein NC651_025957 [Populus alba x Populus x berolinensis]